MKFYKILQHCDRIGVVFIFLTLILNFFGSFSFHGFGVDSSGKLYVGRMQQIEVYQSGEHIDTLTIPPQRGWTISVAEDDTIVVADGTYVHTLSLDGAVISQENDIQSKITNQQEGIRQIEGNDGNHYELIGKMFWPMVKKNGVIIYTAPFVDMLIKLTLAGAFVCFAIATVRSFKLHKKAFQDAYRDEDDAS